MKITGGCFVAPCRWPSAVSRKPARRDGASARATPLDFLSRQPHHVEQQIPLPHAVLEDAIAARLAVHVDADRLDALDRDLGELRVADGRVLEVVAGPDAPREARELAGR